ncbi:unnamed protein product [Ilex paraguariensis]|uniref:Uncharacterized protein n=1 Tax=Ilex paraguariensis TaxID=185542 RepID=A0ABC8UJL0_9AQUA
MYEACCKMQIMLVMGREQQLGLHQRPGFHVQITFLNDMSDLAATDTLAGMDQTSEDGVGLISCCKYVQRCLLMKIQLQLELLQLQRKAYLLLVQMEMVVLIVSLSYWCSLDHSCQCHDNCLRYGNGGPHNFTVLSGSPWITAIGVRTIGQIVGIESFEIERAGAAGAIISIDFAISLWPKYMPYKQQPQKMES